MRTANYKTLRKDMELEIKALKEALTAFEQAAPIIEAFVGKQLNKRLETKLRAAGIKINLNPCKYSTNHYNLSFLSNLTRKSEPDRNRYCSTIYPKWYRAVDIELYTNSEGKLKNMASFNNRMSYLIDSLEELEVSTTDGRELYITKELEKLKNLNNDICRDMTAFERDFFKMTDIY